MASPSSSHCPAHGSSCTYIQSISVVFTSTSICPTILNEDGSVSAQASGRKFSGTMTITKFTCTANPQLSTQAFPVHSGGYRDPESWVTVPNDTTIPAGDFNIGTTASGRTQGYLVNRDGKVGNHRSDILVHGPWLTTGCIAFDNQADWEIFRALVNAIPGCVHNPPSPIPLSVRYQGVTPIGNNP